jgi:AcrR family transcriptional regulator
MKEKIIKASMKLFNQSGVHRITTNHIIDELKISPGTFYYHFKNKEEIIRNIFSRITADFGDLISGPVDDSDFTGLIEMIQKLYRLYYKYRFFYYDISMILDRDETLAEAYRDNYKIKALMLKDFTMVLEQKGILKKFSSTAKREIFLQNQWILTDFWLNFRKASLGTDSGDIMIEEGVKSYINYIKAYMTEKAIKELRKHREQGKYI